MRPYSTDLRRRVIDAHRRGDGSIRDLADQFEIAARTIENWIELERETGSVAPRAHGGGAPARLSSVHREVLRRLVQDDPDATLPQLAERLARATRCRVHPWTIGRALADLNLPRKKRRSTRRSAIGTMCVGHGAPSAGGSHASLATG
jgi:putative transposase